MMKPFGTVSAVSLSHYILSYVPSNQLKLQKLVYYSEGWHLAYFERPLITDYFEAWVHGPAVRAMWDHYKKMGTNMLVDLRLKDEYNGKIRAYFNQVLNPQQLELLGDVIKEYGDKSSYHLEALSHNEAPWREARNGYAQSERSEAIISKETMKRYYQSLFSK
jgi:uncharacterized phage-associated protein